MTVNQLVAAFRRNMSTARCVTPELNMEAVWRNAGKLALCSQKQAVTYTEKELR